MGASQRSGEGGGNHHSGAGNMKMQKYIDIIHSIYQTNIFLSIPHCSSRWKSWPCMNRNLSVEKRN